jgi:ATP-dependent protease HslVU (ClpYQ) peptidase subunit
MTVIAYDGKTLAADKLATNGGMCLTTTKIRRVPLGMIGASGDVHVTRALAVWAEQGFKVKDFPSEAKDNTSQLILIGHDGKKLLYCGSAHPAELEDTFLAIGSGRDYAMAAMHLGHDAKTAVQVACDLDAYCGAGITTLQLP